MAARVALPPVAEESAWELEGLHDLDRPYGEDELTPYYLPNAAGERGPYLRYPGRRGFLVGQRGSITPKSPLETTMVRDYLGQDADRFRGDTLGLDEHGAEQRMRCRCGFSSGNYAASVAHKRRWPDHEMEL